MEPWYKIVTPRKEVREGCSFSPDEFATKRKERIRWAKNTYQAIEMHIKGLREDGLPVPESTSFAEYVAMQ